MSELASLLQSEFELATQASESAKDLRQRLARHILITDFLNALQGSTPQQLTSLKIASEPAASKACIGLAKTWRLRRYLRESYVATSNQVFADLGFSKVSLNMDQILNVETFLKTEQALQSMVEDDLAKETRADLGFLLRRCKDSTARENKHERTLQVINQAVSSCLPL